MEVGPQRAGTCGLRAEVNWTEARTSLLSSPARAGELNVTKNPHARRGKCSAMLDLLLSKVNPVLLKRHQSSDNLSSNPVRSISASRV